MSAAVVVTTGVPNVLRNLERAAKGARADLKRRVSAATYLLQRDLLKNGLSGRKGASTLFGVTGATGDQLGARSGQARKTLAANVVETGTTVIGSVGSPLKYVEMHEEGGTIFGRQYLRIPTVRAQTAAGVDRWTGRSIRDIPGAFLFRSRKGTLWAATRDQGGTLRLLYLLVRSVRLRPRHVFRKAVERTRPAIMAELRNATVDIARRGNGL